MLVPWLDQLKIAMIEKEFDALIYLCENLPEFEDVDQIEEASRLVHEAITLLRVEQKICFASMMKLKQNSAFLSHEKVSARLQSYA